MNDDFFKSFDKDFERMHRGFFKAFWGILIFGALLTVAAIIIIVLVLKHFGIL